MTNALFFSIRRAFSFRGEVVEQKKNVYSGTSFVALCV